ncbi:MAG TPA: universal stress protein [Stellaceae bacterium]|nr:universal stress protein [Stellaceae bacterium]
MYKHILIPTDGSELSAKAAQHGIAFAKSIGAKITVLTTTEPFHVFSADPKMLTDTAPVYHKHVEEFAAKTLDAVAKSAKAAGVPCDTVHLEEGLPYEGIIKVASAKNCDLIVMASHGRRGVSAIVLGSETLKVLTHSKIPVLVYR